MARIGITGANGFIGGHIRKALEQFKGVKVFSFDRPKHDLLNINQRDLINFVKSKDVIIHAAATTRASNWDLAAGNVVATYNLASVLQHFNKRAKLIFLSSSAVDLKKQSVYGLSKQLTEIMLEDFSQNYKRPVTVLRLINIFGEGSRPFHNTVIATFCHQIAHGEKLKINRKGLPLKLMYIGDAVKIIISEIFKKRKNNFYFRRVDSKNNITVPELSKLITSFKSLKSSQKLRNKFHRDLYRTYLSFVK